MIRSISTHYGILLPAGLALAMSAWAESPQAPTPPSASPAAPAVTAPAPTPTPAEPAQGTPPTPAGPQASSLEDEMLGGIDWENNVVYAVGDGVPPTNAVSPAQARARAKRAAIDEAMASLLEAVEAVRVDAESTTRDMINESRVVNTAVSGLIKNAEVVEMRQAEDGSYQLKMRMPIHDQKGLSASLLPMALSQVQKVRINTRVVRSDVNAPTQSAGPAATPTPTTDPAQSTAAPSAYSGLIVDASGIGAQAAMFPRILDPAGQVLYDLSTVDPNTAVTAGICAYRKTLDKAKQDPRAGGNPLVVKATEAAGSGRADLVVDDVGAAQIAALSGGGLLRDAKVVVVTE